MKDYLYMALAAVACVSYYFYTSETEHFQPWLYLLSALLMLVVVQWVESRKSRREGKEHEH